MKTTALSVSNESIDCRIAGCRHERLRRALQFNPNGSSAPTPAGPVLEAVEKKQTPARDEELNLAERLLIGTLKLMIAGLNFLAAPLQ